MDRRSKLNNKSHGYLIQEILIWIYCSSPNKYKIFNSKP